MVVVHGVDEVGGLGGGARGDLADGFDAVFLVAGVDALGAVAGVVVGVEAEACEAFDDGEAFLLGDAGVDGALVDDDVAAGDDLAHHLGGADEGPEVGAVVVVDGRGHGDDVDVAIFDIVQ